MNARACRIIALTITCLGLALLLDAGGATAQFFADQDLSANRSTSTWYQRYHEVQQESARDVVWPEVAALRRQAMAGSKDGLVPVALLDLPTEGIFAVAALRPTTHRGAQVRFRIDSRFVFSDRDSGLPHLRCDFDDGQGWRSVDLDTDIAIAYASTGRKQVLVQALWPDGTTADGRFDFTVQHRDTPPPDATWTVEAEIAYAGGLGSGLAYVYLAEGHTQLTNPVVVIEGFDLDNSINWDEIYQLINREQLLESLRDEGFDIVALNFDDANDFIQRHAYLTVALLDRIAAESPPQSEVVVVGASMGGLVGRYALAYLEHNLLVHDVRTFISFDTPQQGASIPLGLQYWVDFYAAESADAALLRDVLLQPSPRQMLIYHFAASPPGSAGSDPLRQILDNELASLGDYPQNVRTVSVANGSGGGQDQGYPAGEQLVLYEYESFLLDLVGNVWAVPDGDAHIIFDGLIDRPWPLGDDELTITVSGTLPFDSAPGGTRPSMAQLESASVPYGELIALHESHCFIPTVSALDIATDDLFHDLAGEPDLLTLTPFDAVYFPVENQEHILITPENKVWLSNEVRGALTAIGEGGDELPAAASLLSVHPNPFNPRTTISFELDRQQRVRVMVYDLSGRRLATLTDRAYESGRHSLSWDGTRAGGRALASGSYVVQMISEGMQRSETVTLVR